MLSRSLPAGFIHPCLPILAHAAPEGPRWAFEVKHDGYRFIVHRGRAGRYRLTTLAETIGWNGKLTDWLYDLTKECPRKRSPGLSDPCGVRCPDLPKVV